MFVVLNVWTAVAYEVCTVVRASPVTKYVSLLVRRSVRYAVAVVTSVFKLVS